MGKDERRREQGPLREKQAKKEKKKKKKRGE